MEVIMTEVMMGVTMVVAFGRRRASRSLSWTHLWVVGGRVHVPFSSCLAAVSATSCTHMRMDSDSCRRSRASAV